MDKVIQAINGRTISFADFGEDNQITAFYCHGGPGSRNAAKGNAWRLYNSDAADELTRA